MDFYRYMLAPLGSFRIIAHTHNAEKVNAYWTWLRVSDSNLDFSHLLLVVALSCHFTGILRPESVTYAEYAGNDPSAVWLFTVFFPFYYYNNNAKLSDPRDNWCSRFSGLVCLIGSQATGQSHYNNNYVLISIILSLFLLTLSLSHTPFLDYANNNNNSL